MTSLGPADLKCTVNAGVVGISAISLRLNGFSAPSQRPKRSRIGVARARGPRQAGVTVLDPCPSRPVIRQPSLGPEPGILDLTTSKYRVRVGRPTSHALIREFSSPLVDLVASVSLHNQLPTSCPPLQSFSSGLGIHSPKQPSANLHSS